MRKITIVKILTFFLVTSVSVRAQEKQAIEKLLNAEDLKIFASQAIQKTNELTSYIGTITNKDIKENEIKMEATDLAVDLFISEDKIVEVSNANRNEVKPFKIRDYLNKIRVLAFTKVEITFYDVQYISNFKKGPDGKYYGVITFFQKFTGFKEGKPVYTDVTQKNIEVVIDKVTTIFGSKKVERWNVMLGDITVKETK